MDFHIFTLFIFVGELIVKKHNAINKVGHGKIILAMLNMCHLIWFSIYLAIICSACLQKTDLI